MHRPIEDPCEQCGVEEGEVVFDHLYICRKCEKRLKKLNKKKGKKNGELRISQL